MHEVIATGKTVELATEAACLQLGLPREEVSIEILEMPVHKLFKKIPAKVRATVIKHDFEEEVLPQETEEVAMQETVEETVSEPVQEQQEEVAEVQAEAAEEVSDDEKLKVAMDYLKEIFALMGAGEVTMEVEQQDEAYIIKVEGDNVGVLIGHRGETMENLAYLAGLAANRCGGDYMKLGLDVAGYRSKREQDLEALARRIGAKVAKTGRNYTMDPMNPYERRIIHSVIGTMEGVRSESKGEGMDRRVVIYSTDPKAQNRGRNYRGNRNQNGNRDRKGGYREERRSSAPAREFAEKNQQTDAEPVAPKRTQQIDDAEGFALYGKIEL